MELSPKAIIGVSATGLVIIGLLVYFFRASDPASTAPIPYKKFDYGAYMQRTRGMDHQPTTPAAPGQPH